MWGKTRREIQELQEENIQLKGEIDLKVYEMQNLIETLTIAQTALTKRDEKYGWNRFQTYESAIEEIHKMYNGEREWGTSIGSMINLRAAFIGGSGLEISQVIEDTDREKAFVEEFLKYNKLNSSGFLKLLQDIEKEGKCLLIIIPDYSYEWTWYEGDTERKETGMVRVMYQSWIESKYEITKKKDTDEVAETCKYKNENQEDVILKENEFVYRRWQGPSNQIDKAVSVFQRVIEHVIGLEKAYFDQRTNNHLFAAPRLVAQFETSEQAQEFETYINKSGQGFNLKTRQILIIAGGELKYITPGTWVDLSREIADHRNAISFNTGIPVQFLGDPSAVRNKNVSENLMEGVNYSMEAGRQIAADMFNELIFKAFEMINGVNTPYNSKAIEVHIGEITAADWNRIIAFWFPAVESEKISQETFLEKIPGLDVELELERLEKEKEERKKNEPDVDPLFEKIISSGRAESVEEQKLEEENNAKGSFKQSGPGTPGRAVEKNGR